MASSSSSRHARRPLGAILGFPFCVRDTAPPCVLERVGDQVVSYQCMIVIDWLVRVVGVQERFQVRLRVGARGF